MSKIPINGFAVLCYDTDNIGDDIQSIAASSYLPTVDYYVLRDNMSVVYDSKTFALIPAEQLSTMKIAVLINGWFMHPVAGKFNFPPKNCPWMIPMYTSMHISTVHNNPMYGLESIAYFKQYEPIGCRDTYTYNNLQRLGVKVYLSACLTLGLRLPGKAPLRTGEPIYSVKKSREPKGTTRVLSHITREKSVPKRFQLARELLVKYWSATSVVTDRLHCYLPCTALDTPVRYIGPKDYRTNDYLVKPGLRFSKHNADVRKRITEFVERFQRI